MFLVFFFFFYLYLSLSLQFRCLPPSFTTVCSRGLIIFFGFIFIASARLIADDVQRHTFLSCENINAVSLVGSEPVARGRHKLAVPALLLNDVPAIVKRPLEMTSQKRSTFLRSAREELRTHVQLGDRGNEFVPLYFGGCLRADQLLPITVYEFMPVCYGDLDRLNAAWCTRVLLASRIFRVLAYFSATKAGFGMLCDVKPEQFCFNYGLLPVKIFFFFAEFCVSKISSMGICHCSLFFFFFFFFFFFLAFSTVLFVFCVFERRKLLTSIKYILWKRKVIRFMAVAIANQSATII